jgi:hypothetical protein
MASMEEGKAGTRRVSIEFIIKWFSIGRWGGETVADE